MGIKEQVDSIKRRIEIEKSEIVSDIRFRHTKKEKPAFSGETEVPLPKSEQNNPAYPTEDSFWN